MQQQWSQENSYIHKRLIANINLGPCTKAKIKKTTLHNSYIYIYKYVNMICINTGNSRNYSNNNARVKSQAIQTL